jgi:hypothetical protein
VTTIDAEWHLSAFGSGRIVFPTERSLRSCAGSGCEDALDLLQTGTFGIAAIGVDAATEKVYFHASDDMVYECPLRSGCGAGPRPIVMSTIPAHLVAREGLLYLADAPVGDDGGRRIRLISVSLNGTSRTTTVIESYPAGLTPGFVVTSDAVYWPSSDATGITAILRCELPVCSAAPTRIASLGKGCWMPKLVVDESSDFVYWLDRCPDVEYLGAVRRCPTSGCVGEPEQVTPGHLRFVDFALSPGSLWLSQAAFNGEPPGILRWNH